MTREWKNWAERTIDELHRTVSDDGAYSQLREAVSRELVTRELVPPVSERSR